MSALLDGYWWLVRKKKSLDRLPIQHPSTPESVCQALPSYQPKKKKKSCPQWPWAEGPHEDRSSYGVCGNTGGARLRRVAWRDWRLPAEPGWQSPLADATPAPVCDAAPVISVIVWEQIPSSPSPPLWLLPPWCQSSDGTMQIVIRETMCCNPKLSCAWSLESIFTPDLSILVRQPSDSHSSDYRLIQMWRKSRGNLPGFAGLLRKYSLKKKNVKIATPAYKHPWHVTTTQAGIAFSSQQQNNNLFLKGGDWCVTVYKGDDCGGCSAFAKRAAQSAFHAFIYRDP